MTADVRPLHPARAVPMAALPLNVEAEQGLLGAALMFNHLIEPIGAFVRPEHFSEEIHRRIFDVVLQLHRAGKPASPITLKTYVGDADLGGGLSIPEYLARLAASATAPLAATDLAREVRDLALRRDLIGIGERLIDQARDARPAATGTDMAADALADLQRGIGVAESDTTQHVSLVADELMETVEGVIDGRIVDRLVTTGYDDLDRAMNGYEPGTVVIVAGRPGMGKTMIANSSGYRCARSGVGVLQFPLEIGSEQLVARHLADMAFCGDDRSPAFRDIGRRARELDERQVLALQAARERLRQLPIEIDRRSRVTVLQIATKVAQTKRSMRAKGIDLGVVFIDHLDFIAASDRYSGNRVQEIGEIALGLKHIARSQQVCVVLLSQLSRDVEKRALKDRRPTLADLRNSGDLEQVADCVMFLYREEYYLTRTAEWSSGDFEAQAAAAAAKGKLEVILAKVRAGPTPTIDLWCAPKSSSISSYRRGTC